MKNHTLSTDKTVSPALKAMIPCIIVALIAFAIATPFTLFAQAPIITYSGPQTYYTGKTITPLVPAAQNVTPASYGGEVSFAATVDAIGVAVDQNGNLFWADSFHNAIYEMPTGGKKRYSLPA